MDLAAGNSAASSDRITDLGLGKAVADGDGTRPACAGDSDSTNANRTYGITRRGLTTGVNLHMIVSTAASQEQDDHNNPSITVLPDGKLLIL